MPTLVQELPVNSLALQDILNSLIAGELVPYLGPGTLHGVVSRDAKRPIPADSNSLILAMTGGQPMSPRLSYEFPRAAMHVENKKGRRFIERFLTETYAADNWTNSALHQWLADLDLPYLIDTNRDIQLQSAYAYRPHTLVVGAARITASPYRFDLFHYDGNGYRRIGLSEVHSELPVLFKPLGTPLPSPCFVASDADFVDYITELMGGFAVPAWLKLKRRNKRYLFLGMRFDRDTQRMVASELILDAASDAGWALISAPTAKERKFCARQNLRLVEADCAELFAIASAQTAELTCPANLREPNHAAKNLSRTKPTV
jgi:hypothetical protein